MRQKALRKPIGTVTSYCACGKFSVLSDAARSWVSLIQVNIPQRPYRLMRNSSTNQVQNRGETGRWRNAHGYI
jgi:hypothetical protein